MERGDDGASGSRSRKRSHDELESKRLDESLAALDVALGGAAADDNATLLFASPRPATRKAAATPRGRGKTKAVTSVTQAKQPKGAVRKASKQQVHELQSMVDDMQLQVNGAASEIQQLAQLVGQFAHQREQQHGQQQLEQQQQQQYEQQFEQRYEQRELEDELDAQQRQFAQRQHQEQQHQERHFREQQMHLQQQQQQLQQQQQQHNPYMYQPGEFDGWDRQG